MAQAKKSSKDTAAENAALRRRVAELEAALASGPGRELDIMLFDGMGMAIYVADMDTHELLYVNAVPIHISEPTRPRLISYAVFCLKKK
ncbi:MAG TPA: hypothetical protein DD766_07865, partial [Desulfovibrio sp.]|nr:hypothetical protein [Desulfovibrio sp.]